MIKLARHPSVGWLITHWGVTINAFPRDEFLPAWDWAVRYAELASEVAVLLKENGRYELMTETLEIASNVDE